MTVGDPTIQNHQCTPDANNQLGSTRKLSQFDDLLPASQRTWDDDIQSPTASMEFLKKELGVDRLNDIHQWLWLVGRPMPPRPLHYQKAVGRNIIVHEQIDLHLTWNEQSIFLKPIPRYLLDQNFWQELLVCKDKCASTDVCDNESEKHGTRPESQDGYINNQKLVEIERTYCDCCALRRLANGFLITYTTLVAYENDFDLAKSSRLIPSEISWLQWRAMVKEWLTLERKSDINPRYIYGELRLGRLNHIYRLTVRSPIRGYLYGYRTYHRFWNANLARITAFIAYIIVVLTAMQVGLATERLSKSNAFERASYGFTVFSILAPLILLGAVSLVFLIVVVLHLVETLRYSRKRFSIIDNRRLSTATP
ncbi:hypothetical protein ACLMJK_001166 [Lecanora helva]